MKEYAAVGIATISIIDFDILIKNIYVDAYNGLVVIYYIKQTAIKFKGNHVIR